MEKIPKIIHQIWSGVDEPLPNYFQTLGNTWKTFHPNWEYVFWDNDKMNHLVQQNYPQYWNKYMNFKYNIQRWDAIRYLILDHIGGMYVDFDYECLEPFDNTLKDKSCCFAIEPDEHGKVFNKKIYFNNALMASIPHHEFIKKVILRVFKETDNTSYCHRNLEILSTTGPLMLIDVYEKYKNKGDIYLIPYEEVTPFTNQDTIDFFNKQKLDFLEKKLEKAIAIHYFFNTWSNQNN